MVAPFPGPVVQRSGGRFAVAHATMPGSCEKMLASPLRPHCGIIVEQEATLAQLMNYLRSNALWNSVLEYFMRYSTLP